MSGFVKFGFSTFLHMDLRLESLRTQFIPDNSSMFGQYLI